MHLSVLSTYWEETFLGKLRFNIYCNPDGLRLTTEPPKFDIFPKLLYVAPTPKEEEPYTRVYGMRLLSEGQKTPHLQFEYMQWKSWLQTLFPYKPPLDELHCTFNYLLQPDEVYEEAWQEELKGKQQSLRFASIFIGKEGVAASCELSEEQQG